MRTTRSLLISLALTGVVLATACNSSRAQGAPSLWKDAIPHEDGWSSLGWFGWFKDAGSGWLYHAEHGWQYASGPSSASVWLYDSILGCWWWTSDSAYPYLYKTAVNAGWYWYWRGGAPGGRWFHRGADGQWVLEADVNAPAAAQFVRIPAGSFIMGSPNHELGRDTDETQHIVTLTRAFYLQTTEVTKAQWDAVLLQGPARGYTDLPFGRNGYNGDASDTHPVTEVSWYDAVKWLNLMSELDWLTPCYTVSGSVMKTGTSTPSCNFSANGYRLPTEAEWEYACRAGTTTAFYSGPITNTGSSPLDPNLSLIGWYSGNSGTNTHPVGQKQANAWGLYDMSGNVWEWCWDLYLSSYYASSPESDPTGPVSGSLRVIRGGSWSNDPQFCRSAARHDINPTPRYIYIGFRPARSE